MADLYKARLECTSCYESFDSMAKARACHGTPGRIYECEVCMTDHDTADEAERCCQKEKPQPEAAPKSEPVAKKKRMERAPMVRKPQPRTQVEMEGVDAPPRLRPAPDPRCERCAIPRRFGKVVYCKCMVEEG
jgi:hypothetical protein